MSDAGSLDAPLTWTVEWRDGATPEGSCPVTSACTVTLSHDYATPGGRRVRVTVTDKDGGRGEGGR